MAARFEVEVEGVAARQRSGRFDGDHLGVLALGILVDAATDDAPKLVDHDRADARIGRGQTHPLLRQLQRRLHEQLVR